MSRHAQGYKAASGNLTQIQQVIKQTSDDFIVLSGDDSLTYDIMKSGGKGVISVASNLIPERMAQFIQLIQNIREKRLRDLKYMGLFLLYQMIRQST